jgi:hypothetical protein
MTRNANIIARLTSVKGIAALSLALTALLLPACGVGEEEDIYEDEGVGTEEEVFEEEGLDEDEGVYEEEEEEGMDDG